MTPKQKKELQRIYSNLEGLYDAAVQLAGEMQAAWDDRSEKWQQSDPGQAAESVANDLQSFADDIERAKDAVSGHVTD